MTPAALRDLIYHTDIFLRFSIREAGPGAPRVSLGVMLRFEPHHPHWAEVAGGAHGVLSVAGWVKQREHHPEENSSLKPVQREMLSKSLECDLQLFLECFAEGGPSRGEKSLGKSQCINTSGVSVIKATALPHDAVSNK